MCRNHNSRVRHDSHNNITKCGASVRMQSTNLEARTSTGSIGDSRRCSSGNTSHALKGNGLQRSVGKR